MSEMTKSNKLSGKDLMNVGIYTAIYAVLICAVAMLGYIPVFMPLLTVIGPIVGGIPFMLFLIKVKKPGMIFIMTMIMGIVMILTGMGYYSLIVGVFSGVLAELIYKSGKYKSLMKGIITYGVFSVWIWGNFIPLFMNPEAYFATRQNYGQEYIDTLTGLLPMWMCPVLLISCFVSGVVGGFMGKSLLKKHFKKAGIA